MTTIIQIKGIQSKFMVAWQNPLVGASKGSALHPLLLKKPFFKCTFSQSPKQGWIPLLV